MNTPFKSKKIMFEMMFETFRVPKLAIVLQTGLAMYSTGRLSGLVVSINSGNTVVAPYLDG